jgi:hypothetical protein
MLTPPFLFETTSVLCLDRSIVAQLANFNQKQLSIYSQCSTGMSPSGSPHNLHVNSRKNVREPSGRELIRNGRVAVTGLSMPEMIILRRVLKPRLLATFIGVVGVGILIVGYFFNWVL